MSRVEINYYSIYEQDQTTTGSVLAEKSAIMPATTGEVLAVTQQFVFTACIITLALLLSIAAEASAYLPPSAAPVRPRCTSLLVSYMSGKFYRPPPRFVFGDRTSRAPSIPSRGTHKYPEDGNNGKKVRPAKIRRALPVDEAEDDDQEFGRVCPQK